MAGHPPGGDGRVLVKLRPSAALAAAASGSQLRPLHEEEDAAFGLSDQPRWYSADLPDAGPTPWDAAHARVADQLGVAPSDVLFAEPDLVHSIFPADAEPEPGSTFDVGGLCGTQVDQESRNGKATGPPTFAWHLADPYSQLRSAREQVRFADPRTRIAHLDTGYSSRHVTTPRFIVATLQRNFVDSDELPGSAEDPDNRSRIPDNSGHGTGTIGILAGAVPNGYSDEPLGGAPDAEVVPLRVADRVVLLRTSAFARALRHAHDVGCDVVTMSMGGLPMRSWREEVDRAYLAGVCIVAAAGNNFAKLPTRHLVYPARYGRVIAACGVMADGRPYYDLKGREMQGNFGPRSVMGSAIAAYTPNVPWPVFGCDTMVRLNGAGTSSATPQVAAAAALWLEKYKSELPRDWRRVEAVRYALFSTARKNRKLQEKLGNGILRAADALAVLPRLGLPQTPADRDSFAALRIITGLGLDAPTTREQMFELELTQRWLLNSDLQRLLADPEGSGELDRATVLDLLDAIVEDTGASMALRRHAAARHTALAGRRGPARPLPPEVVPPAPAACPPPPALGTPPHRVLRVYATDPSFSARLATASIGVVPLHVRWESLEPGPTGEYIRVDDVDPTGARYDPVDLDAPALLAQGGWTPSEGNAQFHQQMVYAVAMKTIEHFERALGRPVLWRPSGGGDGGFVRHLTVRPHALNQANAFYSPAANTLEFGYFDAAAEQRGDLVPGSRVYTCLSHDIIVHETTHAILDGMHRHFNAPSNPDVLALHEAFADIVALLQHFTLAGLVRSEIERTRGDLETENVLGSLAVEFGAAAGRGGALRDAIGSMVDGRWRRLEPDPSALQRVLAPHARGAILVAAVFDAFLAIVKTRSADLLRIYTGGTGVLQPGAIHPDLVQRLADEATRAAGHVLDMCIRALDYLPPVDVTFFEYLRALITADADLVRDDRLNYRVAFVEAFRRRGIYPPHLGESATRVNSRTLSIDTLRWQGLDAASIDEAERAAVMDVFRRLANELRQYAGKCLYIRDRRTLFRTTQKARERLRRLLAEAAPATPAFAARLGLDADAPFDVEELRAAVRIAPDGRHEPHVIVCLVQEREVTDGERTFRFRGGSTLVIDPGAGRVRYSIVKNIASDHRLARTLSFLAQLDEDPIRALYLGAGGDEPFAVLHTLAED